MPLTSSKKGVRTPKRGHLLNILGRPGWGIGTGRCPCPNFAQITHTHTSLHSSNSCSRFPFWKGRENCRNHAPKFSTPKSVCLPSSSGPVAIAHFPYSTDTVPDTVVQQLHLVLPQSYRSMVGAVHIRQRERGSLPRLDVNEPPRVWLSSVCKDKRCGWCRRPSRMPDPAEGTVLSIPKLSRCVVVTHRQAPYGW